MIPLTFGSGSDWSRNVRAAGGCSIRLNGADYEATAPEVVSKADARPVVRSAFSPVERAMFRMLGIKQFLLLQRDASPTDADPEAMERFGREGGDQKEEIPAAGPSSSCSI